MTQTFRRYRNFDIGQVHATPEVLRTIPREDLLRGFTRHISGDWGELCEFDRHENDRAMKLGRGLLSSYTDRNARRFWIITEADRSATTLLLPEEY